MNKNEIERQIEKWLTNTTVFCREALGITLSEAQEKLLKEKTVIDRKNNVNPL